LQRKSVAERDILYLALTRPALMWGVPVEGMIINATGCFIAGAYLQAPTIWRSPFMFWLGSVPIHYVLRWVTAKDFHWARTMLLWSMCCWWPTLYAYPTTPAESEDDASSAIVVEPIFQRRPGRG
jgi:type IV secretory pathway VirB3-like protein